MLFSWFKGVMGYLLLLPISYPAAFFISLFTRANYSPPWADLFMTYDNPPQGDRGWVEKRSPFPMEISGLKGYINRVGWMLRNKLYGYKRKTAVDFKPGTIVELRGDPEISDKYRIPGWLKAVARDSQGRLYAWEWYSITPYTKKRCIRIRLGWKIKGRKFMQPGDFAPLVVTFNPFDGYGND